MAKFIERTFGETRRQVKVIGRLPGETSCVSLVWAAPPTPLRHTDPATAEQPAAVGDAA
jgi:transposase-like protein